MNSFTDQKYPLEGFHIGLSGSVPPKDEWTEPAQDRAILEFVSLFSAMVFKYGGRIIHGTHPTFTPVILRQAERQASSRKQKPVTLFISELWVKLIDKNESIRYQNMAELLVTKQVGEGDFKNVETRNASLTLMRQHLIQKMNVMVAVGGKLYEKEKKKPGVLEEVNLAVKREMACFLVGSMGGLTDKLVKEHFDTLNLRNSMTPEQNKQLQTTKDISSCVSVIINHLIKHPELAERKLIDLKINEK